MIQNILNINEDVDLFKSNFEVLVNIRGSEFFNMSKFGNNSEDIINKNFVTLEKNGFSKDRFIQIYGQEKFKALFHYFFSINDMLCYLIKENKTQNNNIDQVLISKQRLLQNFNNKDDLNNILSFFTEIYISGFLLKGGVPLKLQVNEQGIYARNASYDLALVPEGKNYIYPIEIKRRTVEDFELADLEKVPGWICERLEIKSKKSPIFVVLDFTDIIIKEFINPQEEKQLEERLTIKELYQYITTFIDDHSNIKVNPHLRYVAGFIIYGVMYGIKKDKDEELANVTYCVYIHNHQHCFPNINQEIIEVAALITKNINSAYGFRKTYQHSFG